MKRILTLTLSLACLVSLAAASEVELSGQIVCSECWFEADRPSVAYGTEADMACAARCAKDGIPPAIATQGEKGFELVLLVGERDWLSWIGRFARVKGTLESKGDQSHLSVATLEALEQSPWSRPSTDEPPAEMIWRDLSGYTQALDSYRGRIVVLNFWATWCGPCKKEMPDLVKIQNRFGIYGVQVVAASADMTEYASQVAEFARKQKLNFPVLLNATTEQMQTLGLGVALPATAILDREGHVVERIFGVFDRRKLESSLERLVREAPKPGGDRHEDRDAHDDHVEGGRHSRQTPTADGSVEIATGPPAKGGHRAGAGLSLVPS